MRTRFLTLALLVALLGAVTVVPQTTSAANQSPATSGVTIPFNTTVTDTAGNLVATINSVTITGFSVVNGVLTATGTLNGTNTVGQAVTYPFTAPVTSPTASCQILDLTIGPINLDLLGLVVQTNTIHVNITAQSGSGQLLGNLLCSVAHLLDQGSLNTTLANLLNRILGLLNGVTL